MTDVENPFVELLHCSDISDLTTLFLTQIVEKSLIQKIHCSFIITSNMVTFSLQGGDLAERDVGEH